MSTDLDKLRHYLDERLDQEKARLVLTARKMTSLGHDVGNLGNELAACEAVISELEAIAELVTPSDSEVV